MNGHEPQVPHRRLENRVQPLVPIEPVEESTHLVGEPRRIRCLEMDPFPSQSPRDHLHGSQGIVAPLGDTDPVEAAAPRGEERAMPTEQPLLRQGLLAMLKRVQDEVDHPFHVPPEGDRGGDLDAQPVGDRGTHLLVVQNFTFDLGRLDHVLGQILQRRLRERGESKRIQPAQKPPLKVAQPSQRRDQLLAFAGELRPIRLLV